MLRLNLLTPEQKADLRSFLLALTSHNFFLVLFAEIALFSALLLVGQLILDRSVQEVVEQGTNVDLSLTMNNRQIRDLNRELAGLAAIDRQFIPAGDVYGNVLALIPPEISLDSLTLDFSGRQLRLRGTARTRADMNDLEGALRKSPMVADIQAPLSNLFVKRDVPFEFTATLSLEDIPKPEFPIIRSSASSTL